MVDGRSNRKYVHLCDFKFVLFEVLIGLVKNFGFCGYWICLCVTVAIAIVNLFLLCGSFICGFWVFIGFVDVWNSMASGFVLCVSGHNRRKSVAFSGSEFVSCSCFHRFCTCLHLCDFWICFVCRWP